MGTPVWFTAIELTDDLSAGEQAQFGALPAQLDRFHKPLLLCHKEALPDELLWDARTHDPSRPNSPTRVYCRQNPANDRHEQISRRAQQVPDSPTHPGGQLNQDQIPDQSTEQAANGRQ